MILKWASPEDIKRLMERIKTKFSELGTAAFLNLAENLAVTEKGKFVPDAILVAEQQKTIEELQTKVAELNSTLENIYSTDGIAIVKSSKTVATDNKGIAFVFGTLSDTRFLLSCISSLKDAVCLPFASNGSWYVILVKYVGIDTLQILKNTSTTITYTSYTLK